MLKKSSQRGRVTYSSEVYLNMTCARTIDTCATLLTEMGCDVSRYRYEKKNKKHKAAEIVIVRKLNSMALLLKSVMPYLVTKKPIAEVLLEFVYMRVDADHRGQLTGKYEPTYTGLEEALFQSAKQLNKRGIDE